jgi:hypothetical protein
MCYLNFGLIRPADHDRPHRLRAFYPYGGFEDFLGQASMETHRVYDARIIRERGDYVQVEMETDYYGNHLKKIFTLYGNSPLLEVRFELTFKNPEANLLGPQPILELGESHGPEDLFIVPTLEGLEEIRMRPEQMFGAVFDLKEGWNAGYDSVEDISFIGAFPLPSHFSASVDEPLPKPGQQFILTMNFSHGHQSYRKARCIFPIIYGAMQEPGKTVLMN